MARYVLIEFDDNNEADNFVAMLRQAEGVTDGEGKTSGLKVRAVYFKPTQFCEHKAIERGERTVKGEKWGLRICPLCYKPVRGHTQHPTNLLVDREEDKKLPIRDRAHAKLYLGVREGIDS